MKSVPTGLLRLPLKKEEVNYRPASRSPAALAARVPRSGRQPLAVPSGPSSASCGFLNLITVHAHQTGCRSNAWSREVLHLCFGKITWFSLCLCVFCFCNRVLRSLLIFSGLVAPGLTGSSAKWVHKTSMYN